MRKRTSEQKEVVQTRGRASKRVSSRVCGREKERIECCKRREQVLIGAEAGDGEVVCLVEQAQMNPRRRIAALQGST